MKGLDELYIFKMVVDCGGISQASRQLNIPKSTLSRRLNDLEMRLGVPLFHRGPRQFLLTGFGRECYGQCSRVVRETDKVFEMADRAAHVPAGFLHVVCPPLLGAIIIEQLAAEFVELAPKVRLHLEEMAWLLDPRLVSADLVIHAGFDPLPDLDVIARRVATTPYVLVGHPSLFAGRELPVGPADLAAFDGIGFGPKSTPWAWRLSKGRETFRAEFEPRFSTTQLSALMTAVRQGIGIAAVPATLCGPDLRSGQLIHLLSEWKPQPANIYAVYPSRRALTVAAEQFLRLIAERLPQMLGADAS
ncbi:MULTISPECIES: LysR substrate-binding domain-containing protein [unclassified Rhizobium]|jgi:DNA-binding transcriptional LysR family regulator|uniref:LysR family transcriptional regulator n=1 Tax=unclassified Rhizobium TaxID=2613769 RepID=UPI0006467EEC|nr:MULTISPECIES: LysR substrate-binding domain-containing protein [unclassified Rhizobium]MBN8950569.1 LysR family transcriptional regulator [Rhizobium tropici]OJY66124.1 MAG: transcriptional regulator [Rhizobium sp. 60-20]RKD69333.1 LysR family transcriptional regulator [Rhizobium sp. WW_1]